jgi:hypothetical protein
MWSLNEKMQVHLAQRMVDEVLHKCYLLLGNSYWLDINQDRVRQAKVINESPNVRNLGKRDLFLAHVTWLG